MVAAVATDEPLIAAKPAQAVIDAVAISLRDGFYNPSAIYKPAVAAAKEIENCRMLIMDSLQAEQVVFTSGGTEANNLGILGRLSNSRQGGRVLYSLLEHPSVKSACQVVPEGFEAIGIPIDPKFAVDIPREEAARAEAERSYERVVAEGSPWHAAHLAYWVWRAGGEPRLSADARGPYALQVRGEPRRAARRWARRRSWTRRRSPCAPARNR